MRLHDVVVGAEAGHNAVAGSTPASVSLESNNIAWEVWLNVRNTGIDRHHSKDWHTSYLQGYIDRKLSYKISARQVEGLISHIKHFTERDDLTGLGPDALYKEIEEFRTALEEQFWKIGFFGINNKDFELDLLLAQKNSEAYLQRTIMVHSVSHWRYNDLFVPVFAHEWNDQAPHLPQENLADASKKSQTGPKGTHGGKRFRTDMAICFREDQMCDDPFLCLGALPNQQHLAVFLDQVMTRCFPFMFIEAKKQSGDMKRAQHTSLYAASRALYNIFLCMRRTGALSEYFMNIRTFSIIMEPQSFKAFIHRATWDKGPNRCILYSTRYTRNSAIVVTI